ALVATRAPVPHSVATIRHGADATYRLLRMAGLSVDALPSVRSLRIEREPRAIEALQGLVRCDPLLQHVHVAGVRPDELRNGRPRAHHRVRRSFDHRIGAFPLDALALRADVLDAVHTRRLRNV